eukprot:gene6510-7501_t
MDLEADTIIKAATETCTQISALKNEYCCGDLDISHGVSFLELKNQVFLDYLSNITLLLNLKMRGKSIVGHEVIERLVLLRVFMEKIKPLDKKLKYQIDKIVKLGSRSNNERTDGVAEMAEDDALNFRPNPEALRPKDGTEMTSENTSSRDQVYQPPKIAAVPYTDDPAAIREEKRRERERKRVLQSEMMRDLHQEISERPEQISEFDASQVEHLKGGKQSKRIKSIERFEEDNFIRVNLGKQGKKRSNPNSALRGIADFRGLKGFREPAEELVTNVKRVSMREKLQQGIKLIFDLLVTDETTKASKEVIHTQTLAARALFVYIYVRKTEA